MTCEFCGYENMIALGRCPRCAAEVAPVTASMAPTTDDESFAIGRVELVRMHKPRIEAPTELGQGYRDVSETGTARLPEAVAADPEIDVDAIFFETARGKSVVEEIDLSEPSEDDLEISLPPEGSDVVEEIEEAEPAEDEPAERRARSAPMRATSARPRGGRLLGVGACLGMLIAGTAIGSSELSGRPLPATSPAPVQVAATETVPMDFAPAISSRAPMPPVRKAVKNRVPKKKKQPKKTKTARTRH